MQYLFYFFFFITLYFQIFLIWGYFFVDEKSERKNKKINNKDYLSVTIIVPCFNEEKTVEKTIQSLLNLDYPKEKLQIFAVDDGSTDNTWEVLHRFKKDPRVKLFRKKNQGSKFFALNYALRFVQTEIVGVLDADSWVDRKALKKYMYYFRDQETMAVIPSMLIANADSIIRRAQKAEYEIGIFVRKVFTKINTIYITPGPFSLFRKKVFDTLGPYREAHHTEDAEIALRMQKAGYKIAYSDASLVYTVGPKTAPKLIKQRVRWTYGFIKNVFDYKKLLFNKKYGELGMVVLPMGIFRIFISVFLLPLTLWIMLRPLILRIHEWVIIGLPKISSFAKIRFDIFYIHISSTILLSLIGFLLMFFTLLIAKKEILSKSIHFKEDFLNFLSLIFVYTFVAPFWLVKSTINFFRSKKSSWR